MITLINAFSNNESEIKPRDGKRLTLEEFYSHIGNGCDVVERITLYDGRGMYLDGDGKFRAVAFKNEKATKLLHDSGGDLTDYVVGNAIVMDSIDEDEDPAG